jgi:hypothetical protein
MAVNFPVLNGSQRDYIGNHISASFGFALEDRRVYRSLVSDSVGLVSLPPNRRNLSGATNEKFNLDAVGTGIAAPAGT